MTHQELASRLKVSRQTVYNIINAKTNLTYVMANKLSQITGDDVNVILQGAESGFQLEENHPILNKWNRESSHLLIDEEIRLAHENGLLKIDKLDPHNIQPASYDLRLGEAIIYIKGDHNGPRKMDNNNKRVNFTPGSIAIAESIEFFNFPEYFLGRLGILMSFAQNGIFVSHGLHVDPGYEGPIHTTMMNGGQNESFSLEYGMPFLSMEINYLKRAPTSRHGGRGAGFSKTEKETVSFDQKISPKKESDKKKENLINYINKNL